MNIKTTFGEILDAGAWDAFCNLRDVNSWCINEGIASREVEVELTMDEAKTIGLVPSQKG